MERVQFQQEQMLAELKDFMQKGIFSQAEIKQIMKKRTTFETQLIRRIPKKSDFLRYAAYEMDLEAMRRKRVKRLNLPPSPPSVSDYALVRRQFQIFERALKKFKDDVGLWVQYLQVAKKEGARALVGRISARALQLHPNSPALYILAASHELDHLSHSNARILLQRGLRMLPESVELWREYVKMELGFVESLRRRWAVLGLKANLDSIVSEDMEGVDDSEKARKGVLQGLIVKEVISKAAKACPTPSLFNALHEVLLSYPTAEDVRKSLLEHLFETLRTTIPPQENPASAELYAKRYITHDTKGEDLVDGIRLANEELLSALKKSGKRASKASDAGSFLGMSKIYAKFVEEWVNKDVDENLKLYLISSLQSVCSSSPTRHILSAHLRLLANSQLPNLPLSTDKILKLAAKYTSKCPDAAEVWSARLRLEKKLNGSDGWRPVWDEARKHLLDDYPETEEVWLWGLEELASESLQERITLVEMLLRERISSTVNSSLHDKLLIRYVTLLRERSSTDMVSGTYKEGQIAKDIAALSRYYLPSSSVWKTAFELYSEPSDTLFSSDAGSTEVKNARELWRKEQFKALQAIFEKWRLRSVQDQIEATLAWGKWLLRDRKMGKEAAQAVSSTRALLVNEGAAELGEFDQKWADILDHGMEVDEES